MSELVDKVARAIEGCLMLSEHRGEEARNAAVAAVQAAAEHFTSPVVHQAIWQALGE